MKYSINYSDKSFNNKNDFIMYLKKNKDAFMKLKKNDFKTYHNKIIDNPISKSIIKPIAPKIDVNTDHIEVLAVINTTNIIDSHLDLHLPNLWKKNLKENPTKLSLQEHRMDFKHLLDDKTFAKTKNYNFKDLGLDVDFKTEALIHRFNFKREKNPLMFDNYINGVVKQHSVGMNYVKISFAYNDPDDEKEYDYFQENKAKAVNPEVADERGFFWVVTEAKDREGSPVLLGSNYITPTLEVRDFQPPQRTENKNNEPSLDTQQILTEYLQKLKK